MDLRAIVGLTFIAAAFVIGAVALTPHASRFLSMPKSKMDGLRLLLIAIAAYVSSVYVFSHLGYTI